MTVTIDGDQTVTIDYADMVDYTGGTVTVSISGAGAHEGRILTVAIFMKGVVPGASVEPLALNEGAIVGGEATLLLHNVDQTATFYDIDGKEYDVYAFIDVDDNGEPSTGDLSYKGMGPYSYTQDGDQVPSMPFAEYSVLTIP
jgi:hypothetical protein